MESTDNFNHVLKELYHHLNVTTTNTAILDDNGDDDDDDAQPPAITVNGLPCAVAGDSKMPGSYIFPFFPKSFSSLLDMTKGTNRSYFRQRTVLTTLVALRGHPLVDLLHRRRLATKGLLADQAESL